MEAWGTPEGVHLAQRALKADPDNPDALGLMASIATEVQEAKVLLDRAVASAEARLGQNFKKKYAGIFWVDVDTRPYMRVLLMQAELEEVAGSRKAAIAIFEEMLRLNPNDNQGVRYRVIGLLLAERMLPKTRKLLEAYPNEDSAWFMWASVLYYFVMKDRTTATRLLKKAQKLNPFVADYLGGVKELPESLPDSYCFGDEDEAICAANDLIEGWWRRQNAMLWLRAQMHGDAGLIRHIARMIDGR